MMGPTAMIPYSHYWTVDHDENNANICIEMLHPCVSIIALAASVAIRIDGWLVLMELCIVQDQHDVRA